MMCWKKAEVHWYCNPSEVHLIQTYIFKTKILLETISQPSWCTRQRNSLLNTNLVQINKEKVVAFLLEAAYRNTIKSKPLKCRISSSKKKKKKGILQRWKHSQSKSVRRQNFTMYQ